MVAIAIYELIPSSIAELDINDISLIKGGITVSQKLLEVVPDFEGAEMLLPTQELLENLESFSFREIQDMFEFISVEKAPISVPIPGRRFNRRR